MRTVTRNFVLGVAVVVVLLLALGALPSYLKSGDPYYLTATAEGNATALDGNASAVNASTLSAQRYPFTTAALENATANGSDGTGQSDPYWRGPVGLKGAFTHSPFDELDALRQRVPEAAADETVLVRHDGTLYRLAVTQQP
ncbi:MULTISPECIES: hypothetical protein [Haloarcula]|uniref:Uncharacterized protein n=1 Tax=Haloarcula pellucida TaxID=1427151 RepID=A0A830GMS8_9EURY|nr:MULTISPECIES: hypothetical protein [Halomicroarcula]MBX0349090.1 hypothetical protein [Halomicroarcula pellucida]MDS0279317.1 hypothetical protein [Halomicroarcula sp. S1AR25-4]GGN98971.1 hypothetical protein GCM10009030_29970 [Halomicroarcula pellucida]